MKRRMFLLICILVTLVPSSPVYGTNTLKYSINYKTMTATVEANPAEKYSGDIVVDEKYRTAYAPPSGPMRVGNFYVRIIGQDAFKQCSLSSISLPSTLTTIESGAFDGCYVETREMTIPANVTIIKENALNLTSLSKLVMSGYTPPTATSSSFGSAMLKSTVLYVPVGCVDAYRSAEYWKKFTTITDGVTTSIVKFSMHINDCTMYYGDDIPSFTYTVDGEIEGTPILSCSATKKSAPGTYPITVSVPGVNAAHYQVVNGTLTIVKAPLSIAVGSYTKKQGEAMPNLMPTYNGFKNGETMEVLTVQPSLRCEATVSSAPGKYPIVVSGAESPNYEISYTNGVLTVIDADPVRITANSYTRHYGEENPSFEYTTEGAKLNGAPEIICNATTSSPAGTYPIMIRQGNVTNYNVTYVAGTLTITKAPLNISVGNYTKKQGDAMPDITPVYMGFKNGETQGVLTKLPTVSCSATAASAPGEYGITISGAEAQNYDISYTNGTLTVTEADPLTLTAISYTRKYGDANPAFGFTANGAEVDGAPEIVCEATAASPVGVYPILIRQGNVRNYNVSYVSGTLTIEKAPLTISTGTYTKREGDALPAFTLSYASFKNGETEAVLSAQPSIHCEATATSAPGDYPITLSGAEAMNYDISYTDGKLVVTAVDVVVIKAKSYTCEYGDANPVFDYTVEGGTLEGLPKITCEATTTSAVGTYDIIVEQGSVSNYKVKYIAGTLTITKAPLTISGGTYTKKQGEAMPQITLGYSGFKNGESQDVLTVQPVVSCSATAESSPGEYAISVSGAEAQNYAISYTAGKLLVTAADPVSVTAVSYTREYGKENPDFEYTTEGAPLVGTPEMACEATAFSPVGTYPIVVKKGSVANYNVSYVAGTLTIIPAPLTIGVENYTKKQGEAMPDIVPVYSGFRNNETAEVLTTQPTIHCDAQAESAPGDYEITIDGAEAQNYSISYGRGLLTVTEADPTVLTALSYQRRYGEANPDFEFVVEGAPLDGTPEITCAATAQSPVGTYPIVISQGSVKNFNITYIAGELTIERAPLTISVGDYVCKEESELPTFELNYEGFQNGESSEVLTSQPVVSCQATQFSAPGEYDITISGAAADNYDITYNFGRLTIEALQNVMSADMQGSDVSGECILPISLDNESNITAFQFDLMLPDGVTVDHVMMQRGADHSLRWQEQSDGTVRIVGYSPTLLELQGHDGVLLQVALKLSNTLSAGNYAFAVQNILLSNSRAAIVQVAPVDGELVVTSTGIDPVAPANIGEGGGRIYDLRGRYVGTTLSDLPRGIYIVGGKKVVKD